MWQNRQKKSSLARIGPHRNVVCTNGMSLQQIEVSGLICNQTQSF
ncbi:hypothetical protein LINPERPRIM_LOCUS27516, partial [Linum perenne]